MSELRVEPMLDFDPDALREKYQVERDKRLRDDGNDRYTEVKGDFAHYIDDPYIEMPIEREPLTDEIDMVIIGGGFGGLLAGARLREADSVKSFQFTKTPYFFLSRRLLPGWSGQLHLIALFAAPTACAVTIAAHCKGFVPRY